MVTGGSGFLGGFVVPLLVERGFHVTALARSEAAAAVVRERGATPINGDLDVDGDLAAALRAGSAEALVNIASLGFGHGLEIVGAAEHAGATRAVFVSTTGIFTKLNPQSKVVRVAAEADIRQSSLEWTIVRPTMIYGTPEDRNMWRLLCRLRRMPLMAAPGGGANLQQPVHVADLAEAIVRALERDASIGKAYDVAGPEPLTFRQIISAAGAAVGRSPKVFPVPARPVIKMFHVVERTGCSAPIKAEQIERLIEDKAFDISGAVRDLGYSPRSFDEGIRAEARMFPDVNPVAHDTLRYIRTVRNLRPAQIAHRVRLRLQRAALRRWPQPIARRWSLTDGTTPSWPESFVALDALAPPDCGTLEDLEQGRFRFLNESLNLGASPIGWDPPGVSQLWLYHHHYWEWAWFLAAHPDRDRTRVLFQDQVSSWSAATQFGRWNAWAPYPTSLRAWVFVNVAGALAKGSPSEESFDDLLRLHAGFIRHNLELDVGGNHLLKHLKALIGLGVYFNDEGLIETALGRVVEQLNVQILSDGGHFEQSPSYHCQVLADLIDIDSVLVASGRRKVPALSDAIERMRRWLSAMLMPDGDVPLFNDAERVGAVQIGLLSPEPATGDALTSLPASGYVVARAGSRIHLVADVGGPGPKELPAHMHADSLTFELAIDGRRLVVDPGTSVYGSGPQRQWERGTPAHNTLTIDATNQTEVWGAFRAGRLAKAVLDEARVTSDGTQIVAHHLGYERLDGSPVHRRRWSVTGDGVEITDEVDGAGLHEIGYRLLVDAAAVDRVVGAEIVGYGCVVTVTGPLGDEESGAVEARPARYATGHGSFSDAIALEARWSCVLPATITTLIKLRPVPATA